MILVRPGKVSDTEALAQIFTRAVRQTAARDYTQAQLDVWAPDRPDIESFAARHRTMPAFVAEEDGVLAGFTDLNATGYIDMLYVDPAFARRGVARVLIATLEARARKQKMPRLHARASVTARPVFERLGFTVIAPFLMEFRGQNFQTYLVEKLL